MGVWAAGTGSAVRFQEIGEKAKARYTHHTRRFSGKAADVLRMFTSGGSAVAIGDYDNDGWQDIFVVNGYRSAGKDNYIPVLVNMITSPGIDFTDVNNWPSIGNMTWSGYQKKKMFRNLGTQAFKEISAEAGIDNDLGGRFLQGL